MAAIKPPSSPLLGQAILAAAMSVPFLQPAQAETPPEFTVLSYKYLDYQESQPDVERVGVKANALSVLMPFAGDWSVEASYTRDVISGASPQAWTLGSASMSDEREAVDVALTRYFAHDTLTVGANVSDENDYRSKALSFSGTHSTDDRNTIFNYGIGVTNDDITPEGLSESRRKMDFALGVTQIFSKTDIMQLTLTTADGEGYYSDAYKFDDVRPETRHQHTLLLRWNHHFIDADSTLRLSYRYYRDSWSVKAHTFGAEYVQALSQGWTLTPSVRLYDQSAADFYVDQVDFPSGGEFHSYDQRLAAFGAHTYGLKVGKVFDKRWSVDVMYAKYMQRTGWRWRGEGSPDLAPFDAKILQFGVSTWF